MQVISRDEIARSAAPSVGDLLRGLAVNSGGSVAENVTNGQSGAAGISLRGLGQNQHSCSLMVDAWRTTHSLMGQKHLLICIPYQKAQLSELRF
ncbi:MAG: TonB-dependent receptor plug domain-containing protein [Gammaproteobacteria bacterium]|nr:TonB-dependent receptor plug domain-containing protein [Gammaproteobacteria bacterium]